MLVIIGEGPERSRLEQLAIKLGVENHVRFEGAVLHKEIPKYLAAADIFLSFYDWSNVGNPLLEAMMAGKCIVTLNNGDTGQFVKNMENGILLEYEDLPRLPEVIKRLLADEDLRKKLGANARRFAEENFWSWDERINAEIAEVERLIEKQNRKI
ncbi:MAG: glycosyltransferase family 4 protein [Nitrososphaerota archaeon]